MRNIVLAGLVLEIAVAIGAGRLNAQSRTTGGGATDSVSRISHLRVERNHAVADAARSSKDPDEMERRTLEDTIWLALPADAKIPIELASVAPNGASPGVEGWTIYGADGRGERIAVYTRSAIFRCASQSNTFNHQCLLRLASVIVHEAWHFRNGGQELEAYNAQILFLMANHASFEHISSVQTARNRVLAAARKRAKARKSP